MQCLARRACKDANSFKLFIDTDNTVKEKYHIYTEYQCINIVSDTCKNKKTCSECSNKLPMYKYQSTPKCDHGLVGGPYPLDSKLYGSPYYLNLLKKGWKIREADEIRAKEACSKLTSMSVDASGTSLLKPVKKRVKIKVKNKGSTALKETTIQTSYTIQPVTFVESIADIPLIPYEITIMKLKKILIDDTEYYLASNSLKLYEIINGAPGDYKGQYCPSDTSEPSEPSESNE